MENNQTGEAQERFFNSEELALISQFGKILAAYGFGDLLFANVHTFRAETNRHEERMLELMLGDATGKDRLDLLSRWYEIKKERSPMGQFRAFLELPAIKTILQDLPQGAMILAMFGIGETDEKADVKGGGDEGVKKAPAKPANSDLQTAEAKTAEALVKALKALLGGHPSYTQRSALGIALNSQLKKLAKKSEADALKEINELLDSKGYRETALGVKIVEALKSFQTDTPEAKVVAAPKQDAGADKKRRGRQPNQ